MGINDDLNGIERPVSFPIKDLGDAQAEVVHSLAKWKRLTLADYHIEPGYGIYTDMNAIRSDEELGNLHSLYVDQWDWERVITAEDRNADVYKRQATTTSPPRSDWLSSRKQAYLPIRLSDRNTGAGSTDRESVSAPDEMCIRDRP